MKKPANDFLLFLVISLSARGLYIFMFPNCHSFDLGSWSQVGDVMLAGGNPYHLTKFLNWPPCWMQLIFLFKKISIFTHWPFLDVVRGFLIATETGMSWLLYVTLLRFVTVKTAAKYLMFGIALNPISIFQVCQHCNFDVLAGFWILLAVGMVLRFQDQPESSFWLAACFALGMGALTKTVPLALSPLLMLSLRTLKLTEQLLGLVLLLGPVTLALSIVYVLGPADIAGNVLGYRSTPGSFGFTGVFSSLGANRLAEVWPRVFEIIYGVGWLLLGAWLYFKQSLDRRQIVTLAATLLVAIPALGPGGAPQYIYWFLPLLVLLHGLAERRTRIFLLALYGVATVAYFLEYAFNYQTYGSFWLELDQTRDLLRLGRAISSKSGETLVMLPLWIMYCWFVADCCRRTVPEMFRDFLAGWRRK